MQTPLLVAVILSATSLGVIIPVLKDAGEIATPLGRYVVAGGTIADFGASIRLSISFTGEGGTTSRRCCRRRRCRSSWPRRRSASSWA